MAAIFFSNIQTLAGTHAPRSPLRGDALAMLPTVENAYLLIEDGIIADYGSMEQWTGTTPDQVIDASGSIVLPAWCDSHTHLVFAASREEEFVDKIKGRTYAEIAAAGGGILNSARKLAAMPEDQLFNLAWERLQEIARQGTAAVEIKSGYGLTVESELKMLRVIKRLREQSNLLIKATFLGAHAFPEAYRDNQEGYIQLIIREMLPAIQQEKLADYIDVFCEEGFFSVEQTNRLCESGKAAGLRPRLHVNQLHSIGGIACGISQGAISLDHLETMTAEDIRALGASSVIGTLLPTAAYFLRMPFQPARELIAAGAAIALASDFNPGSSPSGNMNTVVSMACIQLKMLPHEAVNAATINGAFAMEIADRTGSIARGKRADLVLTKPVPSLSYLPYAFGADHIRNVMVAGEWMRPW